MIANYSGSRTTSSWSTRQTHAHRKTGKSTLGLYPATRKWAFSSSFLKERTIRVSHLGAYLKPLPLPVWTIVCNARRIISAMAITGASEQIRRYMCTRCCEMTYSNSQSPLPHCRGGSGSCHSSKSVDVPQILQQGDP